jgi:hypothetical protein
MKKTIEAQLAELQREVDEDSAVRERLSELLTGIAVALKGKPPDLTMHDWSDLPVLAQKAVSDRDEAQLALRNVLALAQRMEKRALAAHRGGSVILKTEIEEPRHLIRFCEQAGIEPEFLRGNEDEATGHRKLHSEAMEAFDEYEQSKRAGQTRAAYAAIRRAMDLEIEAVGSLEDDDEPTRSVLLRSAASLALEAGESIKALQLISQALGGNPPTEIKQELLDLLMQVASPSANAGLSAVNWLGRPDEDEPGHALSKPEPIIPCPVCKTPLRPSKVALTFEHAPEESATQHVPGFLCDCGEFYVPGDVARDAHRRAFATWTTEFVVETLRAQVSALTDALDRQHGTPCKEIRHRQEVERLTQERDEAWLALRNVLALALRLKSAKASSSRVVYEMEKGALEHLIRFCKNGGVESTFCVNAGCGNPAEALGRGYCEQCTALLDHTETITKEENGDE